jgi:hypothetical protein
MAEEQPWLSLTEAARLTGLDREAIRSRARRGLVPNRKNNRGELLVQVPADLVTDPDRGLAGSLTGDGRAMTEELAALRAAMADLLAEMTDLKTALARAEAAADTAKAVAIADVATARAEVEAQERYIQRLEAMLVEARKPWWRRWR